MNRDKVIVGLFAVLAAVSAIGFALMLSYVGRGDCLSGGGSGGSCPALAEVNGLRYSVGVARGVNLTADDLSPYHPITQTNVPANFSDLVAYQIEGVDPTAALAAPAARVLDEDDSDYRILWSEPRKSPFPALCQFLDADEQAIIEECGGAEPT